MTDLIDAPEFWMSWPRGILLGPRLGVVQPHHGRLYRRIFAVQK